MAALINPANPIKRGIKWALVAHTIALFSVLTIPIGIGFNHLFIEYINNRGFPGNGDYPPGPLGYDGILDFDATTVVFEVMFPLNQ